MRNNIRETLAEYNEDMVFFEGFDDALIGVSHMIGCETIAAYDYDRCIEILREGGSSEEEAKEYFDYNVIGSYVGQHTPCFISLETSSSAEKEEPIAEVTVMAFDPTIENLKTIEKDFQSQPKDSGKDLNSLIEKIRRLSEELEAALKSLWSEEKTNLEHNLELAGEYINNRKKNF
jgi:hypothetical protein